MSCSPIHFGIWNHFAFRGTGRNFNYPSESQKLEIIKAGWMAGSGLWTCVTHTVFVVWYIGVNIYSLTTMKASMTSSWTSRCNAILECQIGINARLECLRISARIEHTISNLFRQTDANFIYEPSVHCRLNETGIICNLCPSSLVVGTEHTIHCQSNQESQISKTAVSFGLYILNKSECT